MPTNDKSSNGNSSICRVGIIIPCYNRKTTIKASIDSILWQTYPELLLVIIDDGSTDGTYTFVRDLLTSIKTEKLDDSETYTIGEIGKLPTVLISHPIREGVATSKNKGLIASWQSVKYVTILHADDVMFSEKIAKCVAVLESDDKMGIAYHDSITHNKKVNLSFRKFRIPFDREKLEFDADVAYDALFQKQAIEQAGSYYDKVTTGEDWDMYLRITERCGAIHIPEVLSETNTDEQSRAFVEGDIQTIQKRISDRLQINA